jgi:O-antigen/teichoic acid export membrane protein
MSPPKLILEKQDEVEVIEEAAPSPVGAGSSVAFLSRSSVVAMIGGLVSQGLKFLVLVYVARKFSVPEFGLLSFVWAVYAFQFVICNSGLQFFGSRAVAKSEQVSAALLAEICCLRAALAILGTFLSLLVVALLPGISRTELFLVGLFGLSNLPWAGFFDWAFQGLHRQEVSAILNVILQGSWLALSAVGMHLGFGLPAVPAALVMATLIASAVGYLWLKRTGGIVKMQGHEPGIFRRLH